MHSTLLLCLALLLAVCMLVMAGQRLRISYPIFLVLGGLAVSYVPGVPIIRIDPELIFLIFLPPLLYEAAWFTSWKDFWKYKRVILSFAFPVVILTAGVVAGVSYWLIPGFTLALGFLLGGIISPPDAVAASSVLRGTGVPRGLQAILEGESLVNDASSLIVFRFAVAAVLSGTFAWQTAATDFVVVTAGGIGIGLAVGGVFYALHRWMPTTPSIHTVMTLVAPYLMYVAAEALHCSGVMAVVTGGLFMSYHGSVIFSAEERQQANSTWATLGFILNGTVFLLIGLQLPLVVGHLQGYTLGEAIGYSLVVTAAVIGTRMAFTQATRLITDFMGRFIKTLPNADWRIAFVFGWAGMRGVVSLAAALSVPLLGADGKAFPERSLILFITFMVILITLVVQGLTLPLVVRWLKPAPPEAEVPEAEQEARLQRKLAKAALAHFTEHHTALAESNELVASLRHRLEMEVRLSDQWLEAEEAHPGQHQFLDEYHQVFMDMLQAQRQTLLGLRLKDGLADEVIRNQEARLDLEEQRLANHRMLRSA